MPSSDGSSGVRLCSRYSRVPNSLGYCGPESVQKDFIDCITRGNCRNAESALKKFEGLYPYLELIAAKHGKTQFDYEVVEAYWLGNSLLEGFSREEFSKHLDSLVAVGLPSFISEKLKKNLPENPMPMHLFNVVFVGVGNITGSVKPNIQNMDKCRVSWGKVVEMNEKTAVIRYAPMVEKEKKAVIGRETEKIVTYDSRITQISIGDLVTVHWDTICEILDSKRKEKLQFYTEKVLESIPRLYA